MTLCAANTKESQRCNYLTAVLTGNVALLTARTTAGPESPCKGPGLPRPHSPWRSSHDGRRLRKRQRPGGRAMLSPLVIGVVLMWLVLLVIGVISVLRVPPDRIPDVLERLFPWRRK